MPSTLSLVSAEEENTEEDNTAEESINAQPSSSTYVSVSCRKMYPSKEQKVPSNEYNNAAREESVYLWPNVLRVKPIASVNPNTHIFNPFLRIDRNG
eukprot:CAMPEP_0170065130 /NCGR_PEP_ID=MMETSP0019_2-20121128/5334_1 /TAXON_ID=98059 /ORGANISM="Dinobryon sp., Strain UTEXLB2267" /LENGTH=96 /DNA_ID=CAMNT_0010271925 /DNA_START=1377 /DNA_END=1667 /DNA_ORIENTATION=+